MKRAFALALAVGVAVVALGAGMAGASSAKQTDTSLVGTGATFPYPLISKWIPAIGSAFGINITYSPTGSGTGISSITARTVDFGASDAPLSADQLTACKGCVVIPWALAALSVPYNLPGLNGRVKLDSATIARIFLGKITNWNDAAIKKLNPSLNLPDLKITPVHRSDGSGSTYAFTDYLSAVSPDWKSSVGRNTTVSWPTGPGASGSGGVAGVVKSTPGALTYVDAYYAIHNSLQFALVKNKAGGYATPGIRGITAAVSQLPKKITSLDTLQLVDPPASAGKIAYPITTFTYVIAPTSSPKAADLRKVIYWAVTSGQKLGPPLLFVPLPTPVQAFDFREIKKIQSSS